MATWKKVILWVFLLLITTFAGCVALLARFADGMCATTIIDQVASPNNKLKAVLFQIDCGATTDFNSLVAIVPEGVDPSLKDVSLDSFFGADKNNGRAPTGKGGGPEVKLHWLSEDHLELQYHQDVRLIRAEVESAGVAIEYRTFY